MLEPGGGEKKREDLSVSLKITSLFHIIKTESKSQLFKKNDKLN